MAKRKNRFIRPVIISLLVLVLASVIIYYLSKQYYKPSFIRYPAFGIDLPINFSIHGIDVSRYQQTIGWPAVKEMKASDVNIRFVFGHTEAMMLPQIRYKDKTIVYMADLLPSAGHIPLPYIMAYDMFPLQTLKEKRSFLEEACRNNYVLYFEHDPVNECCTLQNTEKGVRVNQIYSLGEL